MTVDGVAVIISLNRKEERHIHITIVAMCVCVCMLILCLWYAHLLFMLINSELLFTIPYHRLRSSSLLDDGFLHYCAVEKIISVIVNNRFRLMHIVVGLVSIVDDLLMINHASHLLMHFPCWFIINWFAWRTDSSLQNL